MLKRNWLPDLLAALLILALVLVFLWPVTFGGNVLLPIDNLFASSPWKAYAGQQGIISPHNELLGDMIFQNYSWKSFAKESVQAGYLPLWNPYVFSGMPFLAAGQYAVLYPFGILFYLMPVAEAYGWFTAVHLFLAGLFTYFFLRVLKFGRLGGLISAVVFTFSGFLVVSFLWPQVISTIIWLPLSLALVELVIQHFETKVKLEQAMSLSHLALLVVSGGVALGMQFLAGHMEMSFYLLFTLLFYTVCRLLALTWNSKSLVPALQAGAFLGLMVVVGFGLAAVQLMPFWELIKENYRAGLVTYDDAVGWALPLRHAFAFLMPDFFGNPSHHSYLNVLDWKSATVTGVFDSFGNARDYPFWGIKNYVEGMAYVGILPLMLGGGALFLRRRSVYAWIFALYALFSLLLAFGSPLYGIFFYGIPGFDQLHTPFRWIIPYTFSLAVLTGIGVSALVGQRIGTSHYGPLEGRRIVGSVAVLAAFIGFSLLTFLGMSRLFSNTTLKLVEELFKRGSGLVHAFNNAEMLYSYQFFNIAIMAGLLLLGGLLLAIALRQKGRVGRIVISTIILVLIAGDLFFFGFRFNTAGDPALLNFEPPALAWLKADKELFRVTSFGAEDVFRPNSSMIGRLQDIRGYDTIIPNRYVKFWKLLEEPSGLMYSQINRLWQTSSLESNLLDLMNVKYVFTTQDIGLPNYTEVYRGEINIYRNEDVLPRAFVVFDDVRVKQPEQALKVLSAADFDPRRQVVLEEADDLPPVPSFSGESPAVVISSYKPNEVALEVDMPQPGYLFLADTYFPGWRVKSNNEELKVLRTDYIFRAVQLPQGKQQVVFKYSPDSFNVGFYLSLLTTALALLGLGSWGWRRFYRGNQELSTLGRVAKNSLAPMAAQLLNRLVDFGFAIFMLRLLGPLNAGKFAFAVVLIGYFAILTDFGLGTLLTREVSRNREQGSRYLSNTIIVRLALCLASVPLLLGIIALYAWRFDLTLDTTITILLLAVSLVPSALASALSAVFYAHERMEYPAMVTVATNIIRVALSIIFLLLGWGIIGIAGASIVGSTFTAVVLFFLVKRLIFRPALEVDVGFAKDMVRASTPLMMNNFLSTIFFRIDVMILKPWKGDAVTGWYTTAYKFIDALNIIPSFFTLALFPVMSRYAQTAPDSLLKAYTLALRVLLIISLPITIGTTIIANRLILIFFGPEYEPSIMALQILIWFLPFSYINSVTQYVLIAVNQQRFLTLAFIIGASFNFVVNLIAIPIYGLQGAAIITVVSELILMIPFLYAVRRHVGSIPLFQLFLRPAIASVIMGLTLMMLRDMNLLLIVIIGTLVYVVCLLAMRTFDREDLALLRALRAG